MTEDSEIDYTLSDDAWKDAFDKLLDDRPVLREQNIIKKHVDASHNLDSSFENSFFGPQSPFEKRKKVKKKHLLPPTQPRKDSVLEPPILKQFAADHFSCSLSPVLAKSLAAAARSKQTSSDAGSSCLTKTKSDLASTKNSIAEAPEQLSNDDSLLLEVDDFIQDLEKPPDLRRATTANNQKRRSPVLTLHKDLTPPSRSTMPTTSNETFKAPNRISLKRSLAPPQRVAESNNHKLQYPLKIKLKKRVSVLTLLNDRPPLPRSTMPAIAITNSDGLTRRPSMTSNSEVEFLQTVGKPPSLLHPSEDIASSRPSQPTFKVPNRLSLRRNLVDPKSKKTSKNSSKIYEILNSTPIQETPNSVSRISELDDRLLKPLPFGNWLTAQDAFNDMSPVAKKSSGTQDQQESTKSLSTESANVATEEPKRKTLPDKRLYGDDTMNSILEEVDKSFHMAYVPNDKKYKRKTQPNLKTQPKRVSKPTKGTRAKTISYPVSPLRKPKRSTAKTNSSKLKTQSKRISTPLEESLTELRLIVPTVENRAESNEMAINSSQESSGFNELAALQNSPFLATESVRDTQNVNPSVTLESLSVVNDEQNDSPSPIDCLSGMKDVQSSSEYNTIQEESTSKTLVNSEDVLHIIDDDDEDSEVIQSNGESMTQETLNLDLFKTPLPMSMKRTKRAVRFANSVIALDDTKDETNLQKSMEVKVEPSIRYNLRRTSKRVVKSADALGTKEKANSLTAIRSLDGNLDDNSGRLMEITLQSGKWRRSLIVWRRAQNSRVSFETRHSNHHHHHRVVIRSSGESNESVACHRRSTFVHEISEDADDTLVSVEQSTVALNWKQKVLKYCNQETALPFAKVYAKDLLKDCEKIGEGAYGEVFRYNTADIEMANVVMKVIPIEGQVEINGEIQKTYEQILPEIVITMKLNNLKETEAKNSADGFVGMKQVTCVQGKYPTHLLKLWQRFDDAKGSENDNPEILPKDQLYVVLELEFAGKDMEAFVFNNAEQTYAALGQIVLTLAVAEQEYQFEHRDLHWGNVLVSSTTETWCNYKLNGEDYKLPTKGIKTKIIDYTLSRLTSDNCCLFNDLSKDEELFVATGDYQFDIYRMMRDVLKNNWELFEPKTNVFWISYLIGKMLNGVKYKNTRSKVHAAHLKKLNNLNDQILSFDSATKFAEYLMITD